VTAIFTPGDTIPSGGYIEITLPNGWETTDSSPAVSFGSSVTATYTLWDGENVKLQVRVGGALVADTAAVMYVEGMTTPDSSEVPAGASIITFDASRAPINHLLDETLTVAEIFASELDPPLMWDPLMDVRDSTGSVRLAFSIRSPLNPGARIRVDLNTAFDDPHGGWSNIYTSPAATVCAADNATRVESNFLSYNTTARVKIEMPMLWRGADEQWLTPGQSEDALEEVVEGVQYTSCVSAAGSWTAETRELLVSVNGYLAAGSQLLVVVQGFTSPPSSRQPTTFGVDTIDAEGKRVDGPARLYVGPVSAGGCFEANCEMRYRPSDTKRATLSDHLIGFPAGADVPPNSNITVNLPDDTPGGRGYDMDDRPTVYFQSPTMSTGDAWWNEANSTLTIWVRGNTIAKGVYIMVWVRSVSTPPYERPPCTAIVTVHDGVGLIEGPSPLQIPAIYSGTLTGELAFQPESQLRSNRTSATIAITHDQTVPLSQNLLISGSTITLELPLDGWSIGAPIAGDFDFDYAVAAEPTRLGNVVDSVYVHPATAAAAVGEASAVSPLWVTFSSPAKLANAGAMPAVWNNSASTLVISLVYDEWKETSEWQPLSCSSKPNITAAVAPGTVITATAAATRSLDDSLLMVAAGEDIVFTLPRVLTPSSTRASSTAFLTVRDPEDGVVDGPTAVTVPTISAGELIGQLQWEPVVAEGENSKTPAVTRACAIDFETAASGALPAGSELWLQLPSVWAMPRVPQVVFESPLGVGIESAFWYANSRYALTD
jgi:hypothetical protein